MKLIDVKFTDGPNYWSVRHPRLIVMTVDLEDLESRPTNSIAGFYDRLCKLLPSLYDHRCSEGCPGGFFSRVREGTWMGHVVEHLALELQTLAGMETGFGRTRGAGREGVYHVVFSCLDHEAGKYAGEAAIRLATALTDNLPYDLTAEITTLRAIYRKNALGPSTASLVAEALRRNIPVLRLNQGSLIQLGYGASQRRIEAAVSQTTSNIAVELAADKAATKQLLSEAGIPVPAGVVIERDEDLQRAIERTGFPMAVKPLDGNHGRGATLNIVDAADLATAFRHAQKHGSRVICERYLSGHDHRVLVVNYTFVAAARRTPAAVIGDGHKTIRELVDQANRDPGRGECHENTLTKIVLDEHTLDLLARSGVTPDSVLPAGKELQLKATANLSTGGTAEDITDEVHPDNRALCERVARLIGLDICGIDIVAPDLRRPLIDNGGAVIEVNAGPGLRMHLSPSSGSPRNVASAVIDMLFPHNGTGRVPIIGITGTNGKTTTTRLIAHLAWSVGYKVGCTTTDGIYIDGRLVMKGDCTGPASARIVLKDPLVDLAVLECARGGLLRAGLGFDRCDIAVLTNIGEDHLGMNGIDTLEQLTRLKGVLAESVPPEGFAVLNADDPHLLALRSNLSCHIALFSLDADNPAIREHVRNGGIAAIVENGIATLIVDGIMQAIGPVNSMPVTFGGQAPFNIANILAASLAGWIQGIKPAAIFRAFREFEAGSENTPGRMNMFDFGSFKIIVDYAHNTHGLEAVGEFIQNMPASVRVGVIAGVGDRRDQDIVSLGQAAGRVFDEVIVRQDDDLRGRTAEELNGLVIQGIRQTEPAKKITIVPDEADALEALLHAAVPGMVGIFFADNITRVLSLVEQAKRSGKYTFTETRAIG